MGSVVDDLGGPLGVRAMSAAIERSVRFDAVANDLAVAMIAAWREPLNCALEAVERVRLSGGYALKRHRVVIAAHFALCHQTLPVGASSFKGRARITNGRLIAGFVRGIGAEYHSTGVNPAESHDRFHEAQIGRAHV